VHRDIKPGNIKRTPEGRYVLVDFGIAKLHSATLRATAVSARALTPGFAPIEQYGGGTDERSDIYALGATLYVLLTAKTPPSSVDLAAGVPLPPLRSYNSKIPPDVAKAVERAMKVNANDRYLQRRRDVHRRHRSPNPDQPITTSAPRRVARSRRAPTARWPGSSARWRCSRWWASGGSLPAARHSLIQARKQHRRPPRTGSVSARPAHRANNGNAANGNANNDSNADC
jgi:serine/threonine protein kinase